MARFKNHLRVIFNEDGHSKQETPVPISNTEVKLLTLYAVLASVGKHISCLLSYFFLINEKDS